MSLSLVTSPDKLVNGIQSNANAGRSQLPYLLNEDDLTGKLNYKAEIRIMDSTITTQLIDLIFRFSPRDNGDIFINVGQILTNLQEFDDLVSLSYVLQFRASWRDNPEEPWSDTPVIQSLNAQRQIGLQGGSNMRDTLLRESINYVVDSIEDNNGRVRLLMAAAEGDITDIFPENSIFAFQPNSIYEAKDYRVRIPLLIRLQK